MSYNPSVKLARLYECQSKNGATYYRGRLGLASIVVLKSRETADNGAAIWDVLLQEPVKKSDYRPATGRPDHQAPPTNGTDRETYQRDNLNDEIPF
jgi:hypothetical protein